MQLHLIGLAAAGGALGAALRYISVTFTARWWGAEFPYGTLLVNVTGSFLMGVLAGVLARYAEGSGQEMRTFLAVGVLGGFTTFSAFSLDAVTLMERGHFLPALSYIIASVVLCLAGLFAGMLLLRGLSL